MRVAPLTLLLAATVLAAAAAGCGGDDKKTDSANTATTAKTSTTPDTIATAVPKGGGGPTPNDTVRAYFNALSEKDGDTACTLLSTKVQLQAVIAVGIRRNGEKPCGRALERVVRNRSAKDLKTLRNLQMSKSVVKGDTATVRPKGADDDAQLTRVGGRWYITGGLFD